MQTRSMYIMYIILQFEVVVLLEKGEAWLTVLNAALKFTPPVLITTDSNTPTINKRHLRWERYQRPPKSMRSGTRDREIRLAAARAARAAARP